ncbi:hypothetical protein GCM10027267_08740 [Paramicrobacterium agarici]
MAVPVFDAEWLAHCRVRNGDYRDRSIQNEAHNACRTNGASCSATPPFQALLLPLTGGASDPVGRPSWARDTSENHQHSGLIELTRSFLRARDTAPAVKVRPHLQCNGRGRTHIAS